MLEPLHHPKNAALLHDRAEVLLQLVREWQPALMLVDMLPAGIGGELVPLIEAASLERWATRFGLNVRYQEGLPKALPRNPRTAAVYNRYSSAIGYGDESFEPVLANLGAFPMTRRRNYVGIMADPPLPPTPRKDSAPRVVVLCGGGGGCTPRLLHRVISAMLPLLDAGEVVLKCVAGPLADQAEIAELPQSAALSLRRQCPAEEAIAEADVVVARCGYNTAYTSIQGDVPIIFVPLRGPEDDQENRANRLARLNQVWSLNEDDAQFASQLRAAVRDALAAARAQREIPFMLNRYDLLFDTLSAACYEETW